jgi:hypothetical protein
MWKLFVIAIQHYKKKNNFQLDSILKKCFSVKKLDKIKA